MKSFKTWLVIDCRLLFISARNVLIASAIFFALASTILLAEPALAHGAPFSKGDIVITIVKGYGYTWDNELLHFDHNGVLLDTHDFGVSNKFYLGLAFDSSNNLYVAVMGGLSSAWGNSSNGILKFNSQGDLVGSFGKGSGWPYSLAFDKSGNVFVGEDQLNYGVDPAPILKFGPDGNLLATYAASVDPTAGGGVESAYLSDGKCTLRYISYDGEEIKQYDVCAGMQLPDLTDAIQDPNYPSQNELMLSVAGNESGDMLVGTLDGVFLINDSDSGLHHYSQVPDIDATQVAADPDQKTFLVVDDNTNDIYRLDIATGAVVAKYASAMPRWSAGITALAIVPGDAVKANENLGDPEQCNCAGDPINVATGNEFRNYEDLSLGAVSFHRYYNSDTSVTSTHIGANWRDSFDQSIDYSGGSSQAVMYRADGRQLAFTLSSGQWKADADVPDQLIEQTDASGAVTGWSYFDAATRNHETYDASGNLISITDPNGLVTKLAYSTSDTPASVAPKAGLLLTVTGPKGRTLGFGYNSDGNITTITEPDGRAVTYGYDGNGLLTTVTYPDQSSRRYVYNESTLTDGANLPDALTGSIDETGSRLTSVGYNAQGQATMSMLASGVDKTQVTYSSDGTSSVTYPTGTKTTLNFAQPYGTMHAKTASTPCGPMCGQPYASRTFDKNGYVASSTDFNGNVTKTIYDSDGLLDQQIDAAGTSSQRTTKFTWSTDFREPLTRTVLDAGGNAVSATQWVYNARGQVLARCEIDPGNGAAAGYSCSATGTPPNSVRRWTYTYCDAIDQSRCPLIGLLLTATGPRTDVAQTTTYSYYMDSATGGCGTPGGNCHQQGDLYRVTDALGHSTTINSYDGDGRITQSQDANGVTTDFTYTPRGWLSSRTVGGTTSSFTYTPYGAVASVTDPDGVTTRYRYDDAHRLTDIIDAQGNRIHYVLNAAGERVGTRVLDATGALTRSSVRRFNNLGQLTAVVDGLGHTVFNAGFSDSYDADGNLIHSANAASVERKMGYDPLNRLISVIRDYDGSDTATANTEIVRAYDANDRLTGVSDPDNLSTVYSYDGLGDLVDLQSPDTGSSIDTYDNAGNRLSHTDAKGQTSTFSYDALNRVTAIQYADPALNAAYYYDEPDSATGCVGSASMGRLTRIVKGTTTTTYCYDAYGNVTRKTQDQNGVEATVSYAYTPANRLESETYPDGTEVDYAYDNVGRVQSVDVTPPGAMASTTTVSNIHYLPFGPISAYTLGNGQTVTRTYDANYRLTDLTSPLLNLHYARNALGEIIGMGSAPGANPATTSYRYDALQRLTAVVGSSGQPLEAYTYNKTGDRLTKMGGGNATGNYTYASGTHHLIEVGTNPYNVDDNGATTSMEREGQMYTFAYNARGRMASMQVGNTRPVNYAYNALGERISKTLSAATVERFVYDESGHLLSRRRSRGHGRGAGGGRGNGRGRGRGRGAYGRSHGPAASGGSRDYIWLGGMPVALVDTPAHARSSTENFIIDDDLGSPRVVADAGGSELWRWAKAENPFGEQQPVTSFGFEFNLRFPGQYYDTESSLVYDAYRDYDAATGRFAESDPTGLLAGTSTYIYVAGAPLNQVDPRGLMQVRAFADRSAGYGMQIKFVITFDPWTMRQVPGLFERHVMQVGKWAERTVNIFQPKAAGPRHPIRDLIQCRTLDHRLLKFYKSSGYHIGQQLSRAEAERLLNAMYIKYPEMRHLYNRPSDMLNDAVEKGRSNWWNMDNNWDQSAYQ